MKTQFYPQKQYLEHITVIIFIFQQYCQCQHMRFQSLNIEKVNSKSSIQHMVKHKNYM